MTPYEALYGRKCRTPLCWTELSERKVIGPDLIQDTKEKVKMIREILKVVRPEKFQFPQKGQNRNFGKNLKCF